MRNAIAFVWVALACLLAMPASAAHTQARLVLGSSSARPGDTIWAGIHLKMESGWHTYWKNSGASGMPTEIKWKLPPGITAGTTLWPLPQKLAEEDLTTYIYEKEVVLLTPLKVSANASSGNPKIEAGVSWLECMVQCLPGSAEVEASLVIGTDTTASRDATLIETSLKQLPKDGQAVAARAWWESGANADERTLIFEWNSPTAPAAADFYPYSAEGIDVQPGVERLAVSDPGKIRIRKTVKKTEGQWPSMVAGVLVEGAGAEQTGYEVKLTAGAPGGSIADAIPTTPQAGVSLWKMLLYAFIGGLILNIMPCVLPVIALKILGFVNQAKDAPGRVRKLGLVYAVGVLLSFLTLAALVIGVKAAGHKAGWGMQFGNPLFLVVLTVLVTLVALNLFGLFEVNPGGKVMGAAGNLASRHGTAGAFFNGVLATILATPCTAPFLGAALGFAFTQSAGMIVLIFLTVGLGLAMPYVLLSWHPAWLKFLPKPGRWMERFKVAMGFPMLATAIWLYSLLPLHYGEQAWWAALFLVVVALAAWVFGEFYQRGSSRRGLALIAVLLLLAGGYFYALESQLQWRSPAPPGAATANARPTSGGIAWEAWSPEAVARGRNERRPVLVDFTAAWCLTCQANKKFALEVPQVRAKITEARVLPLLGDYTRLPDNITSELNRFGRAGVPLVLVYPRNPDAAPIVLPEALTPGIVLDALTKASHY